MASHGYNGESCRSVMSVKNFGLGIRISETARLFVTAQWDCCHCCGVAFVIYRVLVAVAFCVTTVLLNFDGDLQDFKKWLTYMTHWSFLVLMCNTIILAILTGHGYGAHRKLYILQHCRSNGMSQSQLTGCQDLAWYTKFGWVVENVATGAALLVTITYWVGFTGRDPGYDLSWNSIVTHGLNSVYVVVNLWITATPLRIYHCYQPVLFGAVYMVFYIIYQLAFDNEPIYDIIDWTDPGKAFLTGCCLPVVTIVISWIVMYGLYRLRVYIYYRCCPQSDEVGNINCRAADTGHTNDAYITHI